MSPVMKTVIYEGIKYSLDSFLSLHPGGSAIILKYL